MAEVAASIGAALAKAALAGKVDGKVVDTSFTMASNASLAIITAKDAEGLEVIRHSTAHLLAYAVKELFPEAQVTIGPVIENGFFYDFSFTRGFTPEDLVAIEKRMTELANKDEPVVRRVLPRDEAVASATLGTAEQNALTVTVDARTNSLLVGGTSLSLLVAAEQDPTLASSTVPGATAFTGDLLRPLRGLGLQGALPPVELEQHGLAVRLNPLVELGLHLLDDFLDARRVDAAVGDQHMGAAAGRGAEPGDRACCRV